MMGDKIWVFMILGITSALYDKDFNDAIASDLQQESRPKLLPPLPSYEVTEDVMDIPDVNTKRPIATTYTTKKPLNEAKVDDNKKPSNEPKLNENYHKEIITDVVPKEILKELYESEIFDSDKLRKEFINRLEKEFFGDRHDFHDHHHDDSEDDTEPNPVLFWGKLLSNKLRFWKLLK